MIQNIEISNFRIFKKITIKKFGNVNLIVGKNNAGKSCFLEALQIYLSKANGNILYKLISSRYEDWQEGYYLHGDYDLTKIDSPFRYLYHGYHFPNTEDGAIKIGPIDIENKTISLFPRLYEIFEDSDGRRVKKPIDKEEINELNEYELGMEFKIGDEKKYLMPILEQNIKRRRIFNVENSENIQVVSAQGLTEENVLLLWDKINLTNLEEEVINCLKIIDNDIVRLALVNNNPENKISRYPDRIPIIKLENDERLPLKNMGDGVTRLFHTILSLVNAKDGYLLIDEIDNGLHWSVHEELWEIIFKLSEKLNIQVFATTHNKDTIYAYEKIWSKNIEKGAFIRIEKNNERNIRARQYSFDNLKNSIETDVEVR